MTPVPEAKASETEDTISRVVWTGLTASLVLISGGTLLSFLQDGGYGSAHSEVTRLIGTGGAFPRSLAWFLGGLARLNGQAVIVLGLFLLIATPVVRVAVSTVSFARKRDRTYVAITLVVLALLLLSFVLGRAA